MPGGFLFANADSVALGIMDNIILDTPSFTPMSCNQPELIGSRRCPRRSRLSHFKSYDCNVIDASTFQIEAAHFYIDLDQRFIGVCALKVRIDHSKIITALCIPLKQGILRVRNGFSVLCPGRIKAFHTHHRIFDLFQASGYINQSPPSSKV